LNSTLQLSISSLQLKYLEDEGVVTNFERMNEW